MAELRERVARGGDPTKLHEPPAEEVNPDGEQGITLYFKCMILLLRKERYVSLMLQSAT